MIQNRWAVGTNDMVACRTMPSNRANPLTASSACSLSGPGEPSPGLTREFTPLRPSHAVNGRMVVVLLGSDDRPSRLPHAGRPPLAHIRTTQSHAGVASKLAQMLGCLSDRV